MAYEFLKRHGVKYEESIRSLFSPLPKDLNALSGLQNGINSSAAGAGEAPLATQQFILYACLSKTFATVACYPYQTIKSRIQVEHKYVTGNYSTVRGTFMAILRHEGWRGFYKVLVLVCRKEAY